MRVRIASLSLGAVLLSLLGACCPVNPPLNSAISAHGNTDWHVDTAEEFLFGTDMGGLSTAANHCPDTWTRRHMHVGLANTNHFYYDQDLTTPGDDTDAASGIDQAMLFFYAGHGWPESFDTLGNSGVMGAMRLGDCPGGGLLRYYWQCSCEVFAHGPQACAGSGEHYSCPDMFDGSADSAGMRNVYERWGPVLDPDLRMACGASTSAWCHESNVNRIWDRFNNMAFDVADSFIFGLSASTTAVPLCITLGGSNAAATPLYDAAFTNQPNTSGTSHYHIQWLSNFASTPRLPWLEVRVPELLPILEVKPMPLPGPLRQMKFRTEDDMIVSPEEVEGRGPRVRVNQVSGATYILGPRKVDPDGPVLKEEEFVREARGFINGQGWSEEHVAEPIGAHAMITSRPVEAKGEKGRRFRKNAVVTFKRQIAVDDMRINCVGDGGTMTVQMNNDGTVLNAAKVWRQIVGVKGLYRVKGYEQAHREAVAKIKDIDRYQLDRWQWGYKEAAGNVEQTELSVVFIFDFAPVEPELKRTYPPLQIEIPGQIR